MTFIWSFVEKMKQLMSFINIMYDKYQLYKEMWGHRVTGDTDQFKLVDQAL